MAEKVLLSVRLVETDDGYRLETEGADLDAQEHPIWRCGCWAGPRRPSREELHEALDSLQGLYNELYGSA